MSDTPDNASAKHRFTLAFVPLALTAVCPVFWVLTLDNNVPQGTALAMWIAMIVGGRDTGSGEAVHQVT